MRISTISYQNQRFAFSPSMFEIICAYIVSSFLLELNRYNHKKVPIKRARKVIKTNQIVHISFVGVCEHFLNITVIQDCNKFN